MSFTASVSPTEVRFEQSHPRHLRLLSFRSDGYPAHPICGRAAAVPGDEVELIDAKAIDLRCSTGCTSWPGPGNHVTSEPRETDYEQQLGEDRPPSPASYRRRGDELEKRRSTGPTIGVSTITLESDANGAPRPEPSSYAKKFSGPYAHRHIEGGIGHNLPQEDPKAFVDAIIDLAQA